MVCEVQLEIKGKGLNKTFTYLVPTDLEANVKKGIRVLVPFGKRELAGYVININSNYSGTHELKPIIRIMDDQAVIDDEYNQLIEYMEKTTLTSKTKIIETILPKGLQATSNKQVTRKKQAIIKLKAGVDTNAYISENKLGIKQKELLEDLSSCGFAIKSNYALSTIKKFIDEDMITIEEEVINTINLCAKDYPKHNLTSLQSEAHQSIVKSLDKAETFLLFGITGSGKTEVYLHLIEEVISQGKSAIVLVPEISLTPQIEQRFVGRLKTGVITLHSKMTDRERLEAWQRIKSGEIKVVIGPRSAVFAPVQNLGIIIMDEEHETSYKQSNNPKYHALDIAKFRSKYHQIPVVLGSATPSLESMARAAKGVYKLLNINERINKQLPDVTIVDKNVKETVKHPVFSNLLLDEISIRLDRQEQIILFLNRRGFNPISSCINCGYTFKCPSCDVTLVYHKDKNILRCHYCGHAENPVLTCPACHENAIRRLGLGTQKLVEDIESIFPKARVIRMDQDSTSTKGSHHQLINTFIDEEADILVGTQMIAKGLDFKKVTLVGVINADLSLNIPDFRSCERTYQLLSQVAGRSGRDKLKGEVIIETFNPEHYVMQTMKNHDYMAFYKQEMEIRKVLGYPPYYYLTLVKLSSKDLDKLSDEIYHVYEKLNQALDSNYHILGPSVAYNNKKNGIYTYQILVKYKSDSLLIPILKTLNQHYDRQNNYKLDIDINPYHI